jgi:hypothetical protein
MPFRVTPAANRGLKHISRLIVRPKTNVEIVNASDWLSLKIVRSPSASGKLQLLPRQSVQNSADCLNVVIR